MTSPDTDELRPVDHLAVEFPPATSHFTGEMAAELDKLVTSGIIRVLDLVILTKGADGELDVLEANDLEDVGELRAAEAKLAGLLAEEDVVNLAAAMEPGTTAGVLVWENVWAGPFASAARRSGGDAQRKARDHQRPCRSHSGRRGHGSGRRPRGWSPQ
ncbi:MULTISPECIES: DUF6325 family protein [unclassified Streptomyces]|uniref:DUF6325 family protein n=1 Tax=unclassified Streptomyces TaxID=2593676 RepID=UPI002E109090|nr:MULTISPECIES: DUF6325 family protein [unclassified Streptomyces]WSR22835.1 DUF6325 family protein [Streptomyces sp. NBC_01205]